MYIFSILYFKQSILTMFIFKSWESPEHKTTKKIIIITYLNHIYLQLHVWIILIYIYVCDSDLSTFTCVIYIRLQEKQILGKKIIYSQHFSCIFILILKFVLRLVLWFELWFESTNCQIPLHYSVWENN